VSAPARQLDPLAEAVSWDAWFRALPLTPYGESVRFPSSRPAVALPDRSVLPPAGLVPSTRLSTLRGVRESSCGRTG
jgi:hypothetical protein